MWSRLHLFGFLIMSITIWLVCACAYMFSDQYCIFLICWWCLLQHELSVHVCVHCSDQDCIFLICSWCPLQHELCMRVRMCVQIKTMFWSLLFYYFFTRVFTENIFCSVLMMSIIIHVCLYGCVCNRACAFLVSPVTCFPMFVRKIVFL